jgi:hypothetical protein
MCGGPVIRAQANPSPAANSSSSNRSAGVRPVSRKQPAVSSGVDADAAPAAPTGVSNESDDLVGVVEGIVPLDYTADESLRGVAVIVELSDIVPLLHTAAVHCDAVATVSSSEEATALLTDAPGVKVLVGGHAAEFVGNADPSEVDVVASIEKAERLAEQDEADIRLTSNVRSDTPKSNFPM